MFKTIILIVSVLCIVSLARGQGECSLYHKETQCNMHSDCAWCTRTGHESYCTPASTPCPSPAPSHSICNKTQYCCPDAKQCLTPTNHSCASGPDACSKGEVCCPLTKICVEPSGVDCKSTCDNDDEYCCPDALHCLTPTNPGVFCDPSNKDSCPSDGQVCCPLTKICVNVRRPCTPATTVNDEESFVTKLYLRKK